MAKVGKRCVSHRSVNKAHVRQTNKSNEWRPLLTLSKSDAGFVHIVLFTNNALLVQSLQLVNSFPVFPFFAKRLLFVLSFSPKQKGRRQRFTPETYLIHTTM